MGLFEAVEDLCAMDGPLGEAATKVLEGVFECGHAIADSLDGFADKLGEVEMELAGDEGNGSEGDEESCWVVDRLDPEFETTPGLKAMRNAVDSIVGFCGKAEIAINDATAKILEITARSMDK